MCVCAYYSMCVEAKGLLAGMVLSYWVGPRYQTHLVRPGGRCLYQLRISLAPIMFCFKDHNRRNPRVENGP